MLDEFKIAIERLPPTCPATEKEKGLAAHATLAANPGASEGEIAAAVIATGRACWPSLKAFETIHDRYGREKEEQYFKEHLSSLLRARYEQFARERRVSAHSVARDRDFELYFTPEEKFQIQEATFEAHEAVHQDIAALIAGPRKREYDEELAAWQEKQHEILTKLAELRSLADRSAKWAPEILDKVRVFEEGWSGTEREPNLQIIDGEIDYYRGVIED